MERTELVIDIKVNDQALQGLNTIDTQLGNLGFSETSSTVLSHANQRGMGISPYGGSTWEDDDKLANQLGLGFGLTSGIAAGLATLPFGGPIALGVGSAATFATEHIFEDIAKELLAIPDAIKFLQPLGAGNFHEFASQFASDEVSRTDIYRQIDYIGRHDLVDNQDELSAFLSAINSTAIRLEEDPVEWGVRIVDAIGGRDPFDLEHLSGGRYVASTSVGEMTRDQLFDDYLAQEKSIYERLFERIDNPFSRAQSEWLDQINPSSGSDADKVDQSLVPIAPDDGIIDSWHYYHDILGQSSEAAELATQATYSFQGAQNELSSGLEPTWEGLDIYKGGLSALSETLIETSGSADLFNQTSANSTSTFETQRAQLEQAGLGLGEYQGLWDGLMDSVVEDGQITTDELHFLDHAHSDLSLAMGAVSENASSLFETDLISWAAVVGESFLYAEENVALLQLAFGNLLLTQQLLAESTYLEEFATGISEMDAAVRPKLVGLGGKAEALRQSLLGIPRKINSDVKVNITQSGNASLNDLRILLDLSIKAWGRGKNKTDNPDLLASGGPLSDFALVGEEGPELIIDGIVIPAEETRKLMALGLLPKHRFAAGGRLDGAPSPDIKLGSKEHQRLLPYAIEAALGTSVAADLPDNDFNAPGQGAGQANSASMANVQFLRLVSAEMQANNQQLMARMDQLILETRRMKTYFRDAVRMLSG